MILELCTKQYTDTLVDSQTILRNNQDNNLNNNELSNIKAISVNLIPNNQFDDYEIDELVPKSIIDEFVSTNIDEASLLRLDNDEKLKISEQDYITLNSNLTSPKTILNLALHNQNLVKRNQNTDFQNHSLSNISSISVNELPIQNSHLCNKEYVDSLTENQRSRRDLTFVHNDVDNDMNDTKLLNLDSVIINREPNLDEEVANKSYVDSKTDYFSTYLDNNRPLGPEYVAESKGHIDMNNFNIENVRFMSILQEPQVNNHPVILSYFNRTS